MGSYPEHLKIELAPYRHFSRQKIDKNVYWYSLLGNVHNKYYRAASKINSSFVRLGDVQRRKFLQLLKPGIRYTYVIQGRTLRIAEILNDLDPYVKFSKHIILADFSDAVTYAGELWRDPRSSKRIILDNNSGTYKPSEKTTQKIARLFEKKILKFQ